MKIEGEFTQKGLVSVGFHVEISDPGITQNVECSTKWALNIE